MLLVSVTRLRIRSLRFLPAFALYAVRSVNQCRRAPGFRDGSVLRDRKWTFWTMTLWQSEAAMRTFMTGGTHLKSMPMLLEWCDEASVVHWTQAETALPNWAEADRRMRTQGRPSKVRHASSVHANLGFAAPNLAGATAIPPAQPPR